MTRENELYEQKISRMTHKDLILPAYRWMLKSGGMTVAFKELYSLASEIPDVIGFDSCESMVIECKATRSDFLKDKKKPHRKKGMGNWRFFCCPKGLIKVEELPEGWGLIYVDEKGKAKVEHDCRRKRIKHEYTGGWRTVIAEENRFEPDVFAERCILFTALRRLFIKGYVKHIYDKQYNRTATPEELIQLNEFQAEAPAKH